MRDGVAIDASLTPTSRRLFEKIALGLTQDRLLPPVELENAQANTEHISPWQETDVNPKSKHDVGDDGKYETIEVPLVFDGQFFDILQSDVKNLDAVQAEEKKRMSIEVEELGKEVSQVVRPNRFSKSDLTHWRHIFELYLSAQPFFATNERDHGVRCSQIALKQLQWFQCEVENRHLVVNFKLRESQKAFSRFLTLNFSLLKNLQFQELNKTAVFKILKSKHVPYMFSMAPCSYEYTEFDKRTSLGISQNFPSVVHSEGFLSGYIAKAICHQMSHELVSLVPQLNDYLCPVCFSLAYRPVRLDCQHVFCIRCVIKIQRHGEKHCPMCRAEVVMQASAGGSNLITVLIEATSPFCDTNSEQTTLTTS